MTTESNTSPTCSSQEMAGCSVLTENERQRIYDQIGDDSTILAIGVAEVLEETLKKWNTLCSGAICYAKDCRKQTYSLRLVDYSSTSSSCEKWSTDVPADQEFKLRRSENCALITFHTFDEKHYGLRFTVKSDGENFSNTINRIQLERRMQAVNPVTPTTPCLPLKQELKTPEEQSPKAESSLKDDKKKRKVSKLDISKPKQFQHMLHMEMSTLGEAEMKELGKRVCNLDKRADSTKLPESDSECVLIGIKTIAIGGGQDLDKEVSGIPRPRAVQVQCSPGSFINPETKEITNDEYGHLMLDSANASGNASGVDYEGLMLGPGKASEKVPTPVKKDADPPLIDLGDSETGPNGNSSAGKSNSPTPDTDWRLERPSLPARTPTRVGWVKILPDQPPEPPKRIVRKAPAVPVHGPVERSLSNKTPLSNETPLTYETLLASGAPLANGRASPGERALANEKPFMKEGPLANQRVLANEKPLTKEGPLANQKVLASEKPIIAEGPLMTAAGVPKSGVPKRLDEKAAASGIGKTLGEQISLAGQWGYPYRDFMEALCSDFRKGARGLFLTADEMLDALEYVQATRASTSMDPQDAAEGGCEFKVAKSAPNNQEGAAGNGKVRRIAERLEQAEKELVKAHSKLEKVPTCVVCFDEKPEIIFDPCRHFISCDSCATRLENCPMCRKEISRKIRVYQ